MKGVPIAIGRLKAEGGRQKVNDSNL